MVYLKDLLPKGKQVKIEYRCNAPKGYDEEDMLFGYAIWNGEELISGDGDNYYLHDVVENFEWTYSDGEDYLTIWIEVIWSGDKYD